MSTYIRTIKGSFHKEVSASFKVTHSNAEISLTRFYNGKKRGANIQLTIMGDEETSHIHLTKKQCEKLAKVLLECFDYDKYPSE